MSARAERGAGALPVPLAPMRAVVGALPGPDDEAEFAFEPLWHGARVLAHLPGDGTVVLIGNGADVTALYPELVHLPDLLSAGLEAVLDGEVVAPDASGRPSSVERIAERMCLHHPAAITQARDASPVHLVLYDLLYLGDSPTLRLPYTTRRALLDDLDLTGPGVTGPGVKVPPYWPAMAREAFHYTLQEGFDGVVAKKLTSLYRPGRRSSEWIHIKHLGSDYRPTTRPRTGQ